MPNTILTPTVFTRMTLMHLGNALHVCRNMSKDYAGQFGNKAQKIGAKLSVRRPQRFQVTSGLAWQPQALSNTAVDIEVDRVRGVHFEWDQIEQTLSLENVNENYAKPAALALASNINQEAGQFIAERTFNAAGDPGTVPNSEATYLEAGDRLVEMGLPETEMGRVACIINRRMSSTYVTGVKALYNPAGQISSQWTKGQVSDGASTLGYTWYKDQTIHTHVNGAFAGAAQVLLAQQAEGGNNAEMTLNTNTWNGGSVLEVGDRFTIGTGATGVYSVHPQTRQSTGRLQQFVVRERVVEAGGAKAVRIFPAITPAGQYQNVTQAAPNGALLDMLGNASVSSPQGLLLHKNAFAFMSVPMENPESGMGVVAAQETDSETGLTLSYIKYFDGDTRKAKHRLDCLFGFGRLYAEMACVICS